MLAGIPFTLEVIEQPAFKGSYDQRTIWLNAVFEALVLLAPASAVGIWLGRRVGLGPWLPSAIASKTTLQKVWTIVIIPVVIGLAIGVPVMIGELAASTQIYQIDLYALSPIAWLLRSMSAALTEEIAFLLGLMTLFVWVLRSIVRRQSFNEPSLWLGTSWPPSSLVSVIYQAPGKR